MGSRTRSSRPRRLTASLVFLGEIAQLGALAPQRGTTLAVAEAANPAPPKDAKADAKADPKKTRARILFKQGKAFQLQGAYLRAAEAYKSAYEELALPELLFNIGQVYRMAGNKAEAVTYYQKFLAAQPEGPGSDEARTHLAVLTRELDEAHAAKRAQDEAVQRAAQAQADAEAKQLALAKSAEEAAASGRKYKIGGLVAAAAGAGLIVWGALSGLEASSKSDEITAQQRMNPNLWPAGLDATWQQGADAQNRMLLLTSIGGGLLLGGGLLYYLGVRKGRAVESERASSAQLSPIWLGRAGAGVKVECRF